MLTWQMPADAVGQPADLPTPVLDGTDAVQAATDAQPAAVLEQLW